VPTKQHETEKVPGVFSSALSKEQIILPSSLVFLTWWEKLSVRNSFSFACAEVEGAVVSAHLGGVHI
jgi:hypothetical protein